MSKVHDELTDLITICGERKIADEVYDYYQNKKMLQEIPDDMLIENAYPESELIDKLKRIIVERNKFIRGLEIEIAGYKHEEFPDRPSCEVPVIESSTPII